MARFFYNKYGTYFLEKIVISGLAANTTNKMAYTYQGHCNSAGTSFATISAKAITAIFKKATSIVVILLVRSSNQWNSFTA